MTTTEHGRVVGPLPPRSGVNTEWDGSVKLAQDNPGQAVEVATDINVVKINSVRQYCKRPPYATEDGHIEVTLRGSKMGNDGIRRGTMYFTWYPAIKRKGGK